ncbi:hypothetical protein GCM10023209_18820 [Roseibacterium beibuensis]|uniref:Transposase n=1 Tax=[Roseibacterium] beibuensis TaxID=1193142 RepID=A0ABP9L9E3_9RHOB
MLSVNWREMEPWRRAEASMRNTVWVILEILEGDGVEMRLHVKRSQKSTICAKARKTLQIRTILARQCPPRFSIASSNRTGDIPAKL